jgi:O-acetylhomoserine/O-acetylserine sulfhydrylase-like pyridoxal-dependent enzyme
VRRFNTRAIHGNERLQHVAEEPLSMPIWQVAEYRYESAEYYADVINVNSLRIARVGSSFGGVRSEVSHPASTSHRQFSPEDRAAAGITEGLVRISVGIEDSADLIQDFGQALEGF